MAAEWYKEQPTNRNFLNPVGFLLKLEKFKGTDFFCQRVNVPDISMPVTEVPTRFRNLPIIPGGGVEFGDLQVEFIVDEDMLNYYSIHKWIRDNGRADDDANTPKEEEYSQAELHVVTSQYNPAFVVSFTNVFPYSLTSLNFDATMSDVEYITAQVTFKHQKHHILDKNMQPITL